MRCPDRQRNDETEHGETEKGGGTATVRQQPLTEQRGPPVGHRDQSADGDEDSAGDQQNAKGGDDRATNEVICSRCRRARHRIDHHGRDAEIGERQQRGKAREQAVLGIRRSAEIGDDHAARDDAEHPGKSHDRDLGEGGAAHHRQGRPFRRSICWCPGVVPFRARQQSSHQSNALVRSVIVGVGENSQSSAARRPSRSGRLASTSPGGLPASSARRTAALSSAVEAGSCTT